MVSVVELDQKLSEQEMTTEQLRDYYKKLPLEERPVVYGFWGNYNQGKLALLGEARDGTVYDLRCDPETGFVHQVVFTRDEAGELVETANHPLCDTICNPHRLTNEEIDKGAIELLLGSTTFNKLRFVFSEDMEAVIPPAEELEVK